MYFWLLAGLALYLVHVYAHGFFRFAHLGFATYVGPRDNLPPDARFEGRALRATNNLKENMPFFLVPAILAVALPDANQPMASLGAAMFVLARLAYLAIYLSGVPLLRSPFYAVGLAGCGLMLVAVA